VRISDPACVKEGNIVTSDRIVCFVGRLKCSSSSPAQYFLVSGPVRIFLFKSFTRFEMGPPLQREEGSLTHKLVLSLLYVLFRGLLPCGTDRRALSQSSQYFFFHARQNVPAGSSHFPARYPGVVHCSSLVLRAFHIVACLLKARTVKRVETAVSRERLCKHVRC
jgi:hypothetical protein